MLKIWYFRGSCGLEGQAGQSWNFANMRKCCSWNGSTASSRQRTCHLFPKNLAEPKVEAVDRGKFGVFVVFNEKTVIVLDFSFDQVSRLSRPNSDFSLLEPGKVHETNALGIKNRRTAVGLPRSETVRPGLYQVRYWFGGASRERRLLTVQRMHVASYLGV